MLAARTWCSPYAQILSAVVISLFVVGIIVLQAHQTNPFDVERGPIELMQSALLLGIVMLCGWGSVKQKPHRVFFIIGASLTGMMLLREQNNFLEEWLFEGAWQPFVYAVLLPSGWYLCRHRDHFVQQLRRLAVTPAFAIGVVGLLQLLFISRIVGSGMIWKPMLQESYHFGIKMFVQESLELIGYGLMMAAVIGLVLFIRPHTRPSV